MMADFSPLSDVRAEVSKLLVDADLLPVWTFTPDNIAELPCIVVGPVRLDESSEGSLVLDASLSVFVLGRRYGDEDSQIELDDYADKVLRVLGGIRGRGGISFLDSTPQLLNVAGNDIPTHTMTVLRPVTDC